MKWKFGGITFFSTSVYSYNPSRKTNEDIEGEPIYEGHLYKLPLVITLLLKCFDKNYYFTI